MTCSTFVPQDDQLLEDSKTLGDCGFTNQTARPQAPATVGLAFRINGMFSVHYLLSVSLRESGMFCFFPHIRGIFWATSISCLSASFQLFSAMSFMPLRTVTGGCVRIDVSR